MEIYILKFSACLALFVFFYKLFLENQNMHRFKRFYLLASIVFALSVPFITFTEYVEPVQIESFQTNFESVFVPQIEEEPQVYYMPIILWSLYVLGVLLFSIKFVFNLIRIFNKVRKNETHKSQSFIYVLLNDLVIPHSFFSYIFLNKQSYKLEQIPNEVLIHEQTHVRQKHSIDVLLIELLKIIFWFNPLIYVLKHAIKLNHEFIADKAVINHGIKPSEYQQLLLAFSTNASKNLRSEIGITSSINYSSIKKRFTVMNIHTSKRNIWLRSMILLPLIALSIYGFSQRKEIIKTSENLQESTSNYTARSISIEVLEDGTYKIDGITANKSTLISEVNKLHQDITPEIRNDIMNIHVTSSSEISNEEVWFLYNSLLVYGFYRLVTSDQEVIKGKGNTPFAFEQTQPQDTTKKVGYKDINGKKVKVIQGGEWSDVENYLNQDKKVINEINIHIDKNEKIFLNNQSVTLNTLADEINALHSYLSIDDKRKFLKANISYEDNFHMELVKHITTLLPKYCNIFKINSSNIEVIKKHKLANQNYDPYAGKSLEQAKKMYENETYDFSVKKQKADSPWKIGLGEVTYIEDNEKPIEVKITEEELKEYNTIVEKLNSWPEDRRIIKKVDFERILYIYFHLDEAQKKKAEPFPNFPPPPPKPENPPAPKNEKNK